MGGEGEGMWDEQQASQIWGHTSRALGCAAQDAWGLRYEGVQRRRSPRPRRGGGAGCSGAVLVAREVSGTGVEVAVQWEGVLVQRAEEGAWRGRLLLDQPRLGSRLPFPLPDASSQHLVRTPLGRAWKASSARKWLWPLGRGHLLAPGITGAGDVGREDHGRQGVGTPG